MAMPVKDSHIADRNAARSADIAIGGPNCCVVDSGVRLDTDEAASLAASFKAIGHPVRLQILAILSRYGGKVCVCDIEAQFELTQPTISHHLKILRQAGVIDADQRGQWYYYFVHEDAVADLQAALYNLRPTQ